VRGVDEQNRSKPFHWQSENIAKAALGLDHAWRTRTYLQFAPQPQNLNVDAPIENVLMDARRLQQMFSRKRSLRCDEKRH